MPKLPVGQCFRGKGGEILLIYYIIIYERLYQAYSLESKKHNQIEIINFSLFTLD